MQHSEEKKRSKLRARKKQKRERDENQKEKREMRKPLEPAKNELFKHPGDFVFQHGEQT